MRRTTKLVYLSIPVLFTTIGCELIARVDRKEIPGEGDTGGAAGAGQSSSSSSNSSSSSSSASSSSGQAGMGGAGGMGGMGGMGGSGGGGGPVCLLDSDCPGTGTYCVGPFCNMGACETKLEPAGTACFENNGKLCNGQGTCVQCLAETDCPTGTVCQTRVCNAGTCGFVNAPVGTEISDPTPGDCQNEQCDATGMVVTGAKDVDVPTPLSICQIASCSMGVPMTSDVPNCIECKINADCASRLCAMGVCQPPEVVSIAPANAAMNVSVTSDVTITFSGTMNATTLVGQTSLGPCTGSVQISVDNFATCYGFGSAMPTMTPDNTQATFILAPGLSYGTTYKIKVTTGARDTSGFALANDVVQTMGFVTEVPQSSCSGVVVISQVYPGSGVAGATYTNDFVELHNRSSLAVDLNGWTLQYASQAGSTWQNTPLTGSIPADGYYLIQLGSGGANGIALPMADAIGSTALSANAGKLALVSNALGLSGVCPTGSQIRDFVGYGAGTACHEGAGPAAQPSAAEAIFRKGAGCTDTDQNAADMELLSVSPRNAQTPGFPCSCPVVNADGTANESNLGIELDYCNVQFPQDITVIAGQMTPMIYGRVYEAGLTEAMGSNAAISAEVGYGPANVNPENQSGYVYFPATFNVQNGNDDEYQAMFAAPATAGSYRYVYRFSRNGSSWTYCDKNGSGSNAGLSFEIHELPVLTVMP